MYIISNGCWAANTWEWHGSIGLHPYRRNKVWKINSIARCLANYVNFSMNFDGDDDEADDQHEKARKKNWRQNIQEQRKPGWPQSKSFGQCDNAIPFIKQLTMVKTIEILSGDSKLCPAIKETTVAWENECFHDFNRIQCWWKWNTSWGYAHFCISIRKQQQQKTVKQKKKYKDEN